MAEEKVNDVITWLAKVEKDDSVELPESILKSQNLLIEIEETIEIVHTKRPVVSAASNAAYEIVEKYDAVRKVFKKNQGIIMILGYCIFRVESVTFECITYEGEKYNFDIKAYAKTDMI